MMLGGKPGTTTADGRYQGFLQATRAAGHNPERAAWIDGASKRLQAFAAIKSLWAANGEKPTVIACFNDLVAFGAMTALADLGVEVGREVAVVGIDDTDEAQVSSPPFTTVTNNADPECPPMQEQLAPYISVRGSCGARNRPLTQPPPEELEQPGRR